MEGENNTKAILSLKYNGPAVDAGMMNVYDAAANMIAFSDFMVAATKAICGDKAAAKVEVAGFNHSSFVTDLVFNVGGPLTSLFAAGTAKDVLNLVNESIKLWKHLQGTPPAKVEKSINNTLSVTNNNGQIINVTIDSLNLVFNEKSTEAAGRFIREALSKDGIDSVSIGSKHGESEEPIAKVERNEAAWFVPVAPETPLFDTITPTALVIEAPVFKDGNKWRFSDGSSSFYADIADTEFLALVDSGEAFAKGDSLIVDLRIVQQRQGERIMTDKTIIKVKEHRRRQGQDRFGF
jgi:hypothetical protein